jgi:hypothetical protein
VVAVLFDARTLRRLDAFSRFLGMSRAAALRHTLHEVVEAMGPGNRAMRGIP